ncbi:MAG TPA: TonB family protein [Sphingomonadaceae bacterium]|nr:TonB family protein [Sphingomonadaceae bacterium]
MFASVGFTALLVSSLFMLNVVGQREERTSIAVVELNTTPENQPEKPDERPAPEEVQMIPPQVTAPVPQPEAPAPIAPLPALAMAKPAAIAIAPPPSPAPPAQPAARAGAASGPAEGGDLTGNLVTAKPPSYPIESRRKHEQGTVILAVLLSTAGEVAEISIARSSGFDRLDKAALQAVKKWRWAPFKRDGVPVTVKGQVAIPFVLNT